MKNLLRLLALAVPLIAGSVAAQPLTDVVPRDLYTDRLRQDGNSISFCYNPQGMMAEFEQELAQVIGSVLLVEPKLITMDNPRIPTNPLDYRLPFLEEAIFILLAEQCDVIMGYVLATSVPDWLLLTRPYLSTGNLLVTKLPDIATIDDLPKDQRIGTRSMSVSDNRLQAYIATLPADQRWKRSTLYHNQRLLEQMESGEIGAAVIWAPALYYATDGAPEAAGYHILPLPFADRKTEIGLATRSNNTYLNSILGDAIGELIADGTLQDLAESFNLGPDSVPN
ncbi:substrate-binding periplasmic protein [Devosia aurantiaca]|uniref:Transporter substrate-binding domain-containing protein n=1 Tax=Devosia aurantiaca TaxID=2714858 RepID=A0A6M1SBT4_9HYPH|nr:transporter substrate-binding domain-containing protein [Devosia aurantiaca]NGP17217.1 transporter substrate-binding domain-containing protein [Devosia aurantiaca]